MENYANSAGSSHLISGVQSDFVKLFFRNVS